MPEDMAVHKAGSGARLRHDIRAKTARALLLSTELDSARVERGFTTRQLAELMTMSPAMINRIMNGRRIPDALELGGLCALLDIPPRRREHLYGLRRASEEMNWVIHATPSTRDPDDVVSSLWSLADGITTYATSVIGPRAPGGSGVSTAPASPGHRGDTIWTRYVSADAIERAPYELGTQELRLARLARFDGIRIVPRTTPPLLQHPVRVLHFRTFSPVAVLDLDFTTVILEKDSAVHYVDSLRRVAESALSTGDSRKVLARLWGEFD
ncbi:helix-turn-helix domain-containing protein [Actinokineospora spheciospongiae]|uniref:helix-turn-helix domain-containing protein n=1 Tax=Actinokineospora spheciospongiae TaxID=909613 RepID=UPI000553991B|nr:Scr1 family TA system antitoxin-like transcriptional regulator [Actinokineospora spheciospongiae]